MEQERDMKMMDIKRNIYLLIFLILLSGNVLAQSNDIKKQIFISSNSGLMYTPVGIKIGVLNNNVGYYLGLRTGKSNYEHFYDTDLGNDQIIKESRIEIDGIKNYSAVAGLNKNIFSKDNYSIYFQLGLGYSRFWKTYSEELDNENGGVEIETGFIIKSNRLVGNITWNSLEKKGCPYVADVCIGLGYCF